MGFLNRYSEPIFLVLRVVAGLVFAIHGAQKLFGAFGGQAMTGVPLMLAAGLIEFVGGLLIALGLFGDFAAFIASGEMAYAYWKVHAFGEGGPLNPVVNHGEAAVLYCFLFLYIAARGTGPYSLDRGFRRKA
ncbi:MAG TPA: DoxX family protein [Thermoanaerobaculia bacterium]|nr:DoxX family protein [Thermoanaerobaculia bacterium]